MKRILFAASIILLFVLIATGCAAGRQVIVTPAPQQTVASPAQATPPPTGQQPGPTQAVTAPPMQEPTPSATITAATPKTEETPDVPQTATPQPEKLPLEGLKIGVDAGHQAHANREMEPVAPGSSETKHKVAGGTRGVESGVPEYEVNLVVALRLQKLLLCAGAEVVMIRSTNDVDISNVERAQIFNEAKTDYALRLHCNGSENRDKRGAFMLIPGENPYKAECERAAQLLIDAYCEETGLKNRGLTVRSDQTGFNWCERMIINIEMGHMTNPEEDLLLTDADFQAKMAQGIFRGILDYYA